MSTFQERIKRTLAQAVPRQDTSAGPIMPFDRVLQEFVDTLTAEWPFVGAAIEKGQLPQMRSLVTWPRLRRDERSIMLSFWWEGTAMKVLNEKDRPPFQTPDALSDYLIDFLGNSVFPSTLAEYERRCKEDVDGFLRARSLIDASADDVSVLVRAQDQQALADAAPGTTLNFTVLPERLPSTGDYSESRAYPYLASGGFGLRVRTHRAADGKIDLCGEVMATGDAM